MSQEPQPTAQGDFLARQASAWFALIPVDETVYSAAARFHDAAGFNRSESSSSLLFGHARGGSLLDLPVGLSVLERVTLGAIPATDQTLRSRTAIGPQLALIPCERRAAVLAACSGCDIWRAKAKAGLSWNLVATEHLLRLCRRCSLKQVHDQGFAYWRAMHQQSGSWVCMEHGLPLSYMASRPKKRREWLLADHCLESGQLLEPPVGSDTDLAFLRRIAEVLHWMSTRPSIDIEVLLAAVRERLVRSGLLRNEVACSRAEYEAIHDRFTRPLAAAKLPHYEGFRTGGWVRQVLIDRRNLHPVRWAVLLAAGGGTDAISLDMDLLQASSRLVQPGLFGDESVQRRSRAPEHVYEALTGPVRIADAAKISKIRKSELQGWLRRDAQLVEHRKLTSNDVRHRAALLTIEGFRRANPSAERSAVIKSCLWAVRCLEAHDRQALELALPRPVAMFDRQARLDFGD